jgi:hypothetical protein
MYPVVVGQTLLAGEHLHDLGLGVEITDPLRFGTYALAGPTGDCRKANGGRTTRGGELHALHLTPAAELPPDDSPELG